ncbi:MAG: hypothetical protein QOI41_817 [Myxococcales bacterium]|nr:hypothetical protein [Myxococcales bacterium]
MLHASLLSRASFVSLLVVLATCGACGAEPPAPVVPKAAPPAPAATPSVETVAAAPAETKRELTADETATAPWGATFQASKGWSMTTRSDLVVLEAPERDLKVTLVELTESDGDRAIAAAWKRVDPTFARATKTRTTPPGRDGWDAVTQILYETPVAESRLVVAIARKKGDRMHVTLLDGSNAAADRRGAQMGTVIASYKPKGLEEESFAGKKANVLDAARLATLTAFIEESRKAAEIPGVAIAIVQDGKVVLAKGFGVKELGKNDAVTSKSLFIIASMSKSLATLMMAKLVDDGAFEWSSPVTKLLPSFALGDAAATKELTMRHTVCACTGMPRQDAEFELEYGAATPESRVESMRGMKPTTGFGETFQYSNTLVATGGYVAAHAVEPKKGLGPAFDAVLRAKVLVPYGMTSTTMDLGVVRRVDHASPHGLGPDAHPHVTPIVDDDGPVAALRPAGGVWSNVDDFARVLLVELGRGQINGKRVVSEQNLLARREPQVKIDDKTAYGLGVFLEKRNGVPLVGHGGNLLGYTSDYFFLPDHGVGLVVLTNAGSANSFRNALKRRLLEVLFDGRPEAKENLAFGLDRRQKAYDVELARVAQKPSAAFVERVLGTWTSPGLGKVIIKKDKDRATADVGEWASSFGEKTEPDGAKAIFFLDAPHAGAELLVQEKDGTTTLLFDMNQQKYVFSREAPTKPTKP